MFDANLLFSSAAAITTTGYSTVLDVKKTPAEGVPVEIAITAIAGSTTGLTLDAKVQECDTTNGTFVDVATFPQMSAVGRKTRVVQSKKRYLRIAYTAGAATGLSATVTAGIVSGNNPDEVA